MSLEVWCSQSGVPGSTGPIQGRFAGAKRKLRHAFAALIEQYDPTYLLNTNEQF
jgi:hypothetical protein